MHQWLFNSLVSKDRKTSSLKVNEIASDRFLSAQAAGKSAEFPSHFGSNFASS
jgi:hypothetical protein